MEEYEDIENDAFDACDATAATAGEQEHEALHQNRQVARQLELEAERNQSVNPGVLKATSGNAAKRLKVRQETRATTRAGKSAEAAIKQIAAQELQVEKGRMQEWKQVVMQEVARELQAIRQAHEEAIEAQRHSFQMELERVREKLQQVESRSMTLENEINSLKAQKQTPDQRPFQNVPATKNIPIVPSSSKQTEGKKMADPPRRSYAQMAVSNSAKNTTEKAWTEVTSSSRRRKVTTPVMPKVEPEKRRVIFRRELLSPQKSEADLMLALNESLQKAGVPAYTRFSKVGYSQSGAISALLTEKSNAEELISSHSNILIRAAKSVDEGVVGVEALERWQRLKVHGMSLARYLGEGKMEVLCREIESSTGIQLKTLPRWLINETRLEERLESGNGRGSAIVITVGNGVEASKLCSKGLRFGGALKVVEKYWEAGPGSVCMSCAGVGHDRMGECGDRAIQCVICAGAHKVENHKCGVTGCTTKVGKICTHVTPKCANCGGNHQATAFRCPARLKAQAESWREKVKKSQAKGKQPAINEVPEKESVMGSVGMELDTELNWAKSPGEQSSDLSSLEDNMPEDSQDKW